MSYSSQMIVVGPSEFDKLGRVSNVDGVPLYLLPKSIGIALVSSGYTSQKGLETVEKIRKVLNYESEDESRN